MVVNILVCYSSVDASLVDRLESILKPLQQDGSMKWHNCEIGEDAHWKQVINKHSNTSQIILLLISPDFMATDYPYGAEMSQILERHEQGKALVIPIILRAVYWQRASFAKLQVLPTHGDYVTSPDWKNLDEALFDVADGIRNAIEKFGVKPVAVPHEEPAQNATAPAKDSTTRVSFFGNLAVKYLCPSCIEEFYLGDCDIISTITGKELKTAPTGGWLERQRARVYPEPLTGRKYVLGLARRSCVNCGYILPENIERASNLRIAVIGDIASGKSTYIASLLHQMQHEWTPGDNGSFRLICLTPDVEAELSGRNSGPLFHDRRVLPSTPPAQNENKTPLIYELAVRESPKSPVRVTDLIFYDGASEDYLSTQRMAQFARYIFYAHAIIFLVDPNTMPGISHQLPSERRPAHLLRSILNMRESFYGLNNTNRLLVAITISKSDLLKYLHPSVLSYTFLSKPTYSGRFDLKDAEAVNKEVQAIIQDAGQSDLLALARGLEQVNFFAVSATGTYPFVDPYRCLDPILWILYKLGVIRGSIS